MSPLKSSLLTGVLALCSMVKTNGQGVTAPAKVIPDSLVLKNGVTVKPSAQIVFSEKNKKALVFMGYFIKNKMEVDSAGYQSLCESKMMQDHVSSVMDKGFQDTTATKNAGHIFYNILEKPEETLNAAQLQIHNAKSTAEAYDKLITSLQKHGLDLDTFYDTALDVIKDTAPSSQYWRTNRIVGNTSSLTENPILKPE